MISLALAAKQGFDRANYYADHSKCQASVLNPGPGGPDKLHARLIPPNPRRGDLWNANLLINLGLFGRIDLDSRGRLLNERRQGVNERECGGIPVLLQALSSWGKP